LGLGVDQIFLASVLTLLLLLIVSIELLHCFLVFGNRAFFLLVLNKLNYLDLLLSLFPFHFVRKF
jgi:hypothetical protein